MMRGGIAREYPDDWRCLKCRRWFPADEPEGPNGYCCDCDEADEWEYREQERLEREGEG